MNNNVHKLYLQKQDKELEEDIEKEEKWERGNKAKTIKYCFYLLATGILLFFIGEALGNTLESLCKRFDVSEIIIGILLGFITSLPELITFFEAQKHHKNSKDDMLGIVEATNNLLTSNILNLFVIQTIGILISVGV
jgi:Ca2+/Na+ antiporter